MSRPSGFNKQSAIDDSSVCYQICPDNRNLTK